MNLTACLFEQKYKGFVVVDEAYIDFADTSSLCTLVNKHKRLIVLQTLSKGFGLAGIRLGIAFGDPKLIHVLNNVKAPYNISKLTSDVARKAFANLEELRKSVNLIKKVRGRVMLLSFCFVANYFVAITTTQRKNTGWLRSCRSCHLCAAYMPQTPTSCFSR